MILRDISKNYGEKTVLSHLSLTIPDKGLILVTGASGSGKTTLLRVIAGLTEPDGGSVEDRKTVSVAFQEHRLFGFLSALDNLTKTVTTDRAKAMRTLAELGLTEADAALRADRLSGGMAQRVSLARAFLAEGDILLLDEPTKELDAASADRVTKRVEAEAKRRAVVVSTHDPERFFAFTNENKKL